MPFASTLKTFKTLLKSWKTKVNESWALKLKFAKLKAKCRANNLPTLAIWCGAGRQVKEMGGGAQGGICRWQMKHLARNCVPVSYCNGRHLAACQCSIDVYIHRLTHTHTHAQAHAHICTCLSYTLVFVIDMAVARTAKRFTHLPHSSLHYSIHLSLSVYASLSLTFRI